jgi:hypothetical protein
MGTLTPWFFLWGFLLFCGDLPLYEFTKAEESHAIRVQGAFTSIKNTCFVNNNFTAPAPVVLESAFFVFIGNSVTTTNTEQSVCPFAVYYRDEQAIANDIFTCVDAQEATCDKEYAMYSQFP